MLITLLKDNITFTTTDIPSTINTRITELQAVKVHHNNTKDITIANIYIPPRDSTSTHYKTADTDIQHFIQHITKIPHSVLTGDVKAHSTLWHSYTDDHRGQLVADVISNSDHVTRHTNQKACWTQFTEDTRVRCRSDHVTHQYTHCQHNFHKHHTDGRQEQYTKGQDAQQLQALTRRHSMQITQRNNIRRANTCDPALKLLNEEITSDIQKHKQNLWKEHLDVHWDHRHKTHML